MLTLAQIPNITMNGYVTITNKPVQWKNLFRMFKFSGENLQDDSIYSPVLENGKILPLQGEFSQAHLADYFDGLFPVGNYVECRFEYDFLLTPVGISYTTEGDFELFLGKIWDCLTGTSLYPYLLLSHFNQYAKKSGELKAEHYHLLIPQARTSDLTFDRDLNIFFEKLQSTNTVRVLEIKTDFKEKT